MELGAAFNRGSILLFMVAFLCLSAVESKAGADAVPSYQKVGKVKVPFGANIQKPYILDAIDVNGDGADDIALSARIPNKRSGDLHSAPKVSSLFGLNQISAGKFAMFSLGEAGRTHRTFSGAFFRNGRSGPVFLALARNGELGGPYDNPGEPTSIFSIREQGGKVGIGLVFEGKELSTSDNAAACDINRDGRTELYINNGAARFKIYPRLKSHVYTVSGGGVRERSEQSVFRSKWLGRGSNNFVALKDIDGDGDCDALFAVEAWKPSEGDGPEPSGTKYRYSSYVIFNKGGFGGNRYDLPNPPFGKDNSAFGIGGTSVNGVPMVALASQKFPGHKEGHSGYALQLFEFDGRKFIDVSGAKLRSVISPGGGETYFIRFADIDGDGDEDFYIRNLGSSGRPHFYLNRNGIFHGQRLKINGPQGRKSVFFLNAPGKKCMDLVVLDARANLHIYSCRQT